MFHEACDLHRATWKTVAERLHIDLPGWTLLSEAPAIILLEIVKRIEKLEEKNDN